MFILQWFICSWQYRKNKKISQIDHILITQKNIYVIETKWYSLNEYNSLYGDTSEKWLLLVNKTNDKQTKILNPSYQNKTHIKNLKTLLKNYIDISEFDIKNIVIYKNNFYNKTFFKDQSKYVNYGSYNLSSFLKYIEKNFNFVENSWYL
ncbi:MAG: nuclease-related domain-containing protein [Spiroplasma sp. hy2]|uniref:nuclease-related domain-containing protein n=1 Tax=Spiroplasma sp. hy2 TaxID=2490850 RepID=UPI00383F8C91